MRIRPIDPASETEIAWVAQRMRATLIEVEGEAVGAALYSMDWLRDRVRWHLDASRVAAVLLAEDASGQVVGHTIVRREREDGEPFGLISTTFVDPGARRRGIADALLLAGESWVIGQGLSACSTWTSCGNAKLIALYEKHGYRRGESATHTVTATMMLRLSKSFSRV